MFSAVVVEAGLAALDRDLVDATRETGAAVIVIDDGRVRTDWRALGVDAVLPDALDRNVLLATLVDCASPLSRPSTAATEPDAGPEPGWRGRLVAVTGAPGAGRSTVAMALAEGLARVGPPGSVALADFALHADQALLHDVGDVVPGVQELVESHRRGRPSTDAIRALTFAPAGRDHLVLLGLRRHRDWTVLRPRSVQAAVDGLMRSFATVVTDVDADFEGDDEVGSLDVEDRNVLARTACRRADLVIVTAAPTVVGLRRLAVVLDDLRRLGVGPDRVLPLLNRAPRRPRARAELTAAVAELAAAAHPDLARLTSPVFLPDRRTLDDVVRAGGPLPRSLTQPLARSVAALLEQAPIVPAGLDGLEPVPVAPGSLGSWAEQEATG